MCLVYTIFIQCALWSRKCWAQVMHMIPLLLNMSLWFSKVIHFNLFPPKTQCHATYTWTHNIVGVVLATYFGFKSPSGAFILTSHCGFIYISQ